MDTGLDGKVVWITGASGGIGREVARVFAAEGARLVLQGRSQFESLQSWARAEGLDERALCLRYDVRDRAASFDAAARAVEHFGRLDVCVANAGVWPAADEPFHRMSEARVRDTVDTNLLGAAWTAQAFLHALEETGPRDDGDGAALVFTGSTAGRFGERDHADYALTKAGMYGLVRTLKNELPRLDPYARVNLVEPGWTVTEMAREALEDDEAVARVARTLALRQLARARDIAHAVVFLASPALARHISGEVLTVSGGMEGRLLWDRPEVDVQEIRRRLGPD